MKSSMGKKLYTFIEDLFPINRSITGEGTKKTLEYIQNIIPIQIKSKPSGSKVFDWTIPKEWNIKSAYIENSKGEKIIDFKDNNLHIVGYSIPVDKKMSLKELDKHLYSLEDQPNAIPYVTSYYKERWGFCMTHNQRMNLEDDIYHVFIDSSLSEGNLYYGELKIPGLSEKEILLSTYICHPSMANNELSGPSVTTYLSKWLLNKERLNYSYRIIFIPETIGSITYLSENYKIMKQNTIAGFNITCVGDELNYSFLETPYGNTLADRVAKNVLKNVDYTHYSFLERGSDERQYCSPGINLPVVSIMRTKYDEYKEYHTSLDDLSFVTEKGLEESYKLYIKALNVLENNFVYKVTTLCEPQLGKRGLYPTISMKNDATSNVRNLMNIIAYCDGKNDTIDISDRLDIEIEEVIRIQKVLKENDLIEKI